MRIMIFCFKSWHSISILETPSVANYTKADGKNEKKDQKDRTHYNDGGGTSCDIVYWFNTIDTIDMK